MELGAGLLRQVARARRLCVRNRHEPDGGVLRRQPRAQPADAAGADACAQAAYTPATLRTSIQLALPGSFRAPGF
jgi:hypothetical protein